MKRYKTCLLLVMFLLLPHALLAAMVRGRLLLMTARGPQPAAGIAVTVFSQRFGRSPPVKSGPDGMYYLYNIPAGFYTLEVWLGPGAAPRPYPIQVREPYSDIPQIRL
jgi:hypothetical protein